MDSEEIERREGLRFSWNSWANNKETIQGLGVPIGCVYSPFKPLEEDRKIFREPTGCRCGAVINLYCEIDAAGKYWICPFCKSRTTLPENYQCLKKDALPIELTEQGGTVEYCKKLEKPMEVTYIFLVDTALSSNDELKALKESLLMSLSMLRKDTLVGLILFGKDIRLYDLGFTDMQKNYLFSGQRGYTQPELKSMLPKGSNNRQNTRAQQEYTFFAPVSHCEMLLENIFLELERDPWAVRSGMRPLRCSGGALNLAILIPLLLGNNGPTKIVFFCSGPATVGMGKIVGENLSEPLRSYKDVEMSTAIHINEAVRLYENLAQQAIKGNTTVDILVGCLDQTGLYEMKALVNQTGGTILLSDSFESPRFKKSCLSLFDPAASIISWRVFVLTTRELKVSKLIGLGGSTGDNKETIPGKVGLEGAVRWTLGLCTLETHLAFYFDLLQAAEGSKFGLVQFNSLSYSLDGTKCLRITTAGRMFTSDKQKLLGSFDQFTAAVLLAKIAMVRAESSEGNDSYKWLDGKLINFCKQAALFQPNNPDSFSLPPHISLFPQTIFHLRRSNFLSHFNCSPDETTAYRHALLRENVRNSMVMLQPALMSYSIGNDPVPVLLDATSIKQDTILLLDSYFHIVLFHGEFVTHWRNQELHNTEEYADFGKMLKRAEADALALLEKRMPMPIYINCDHNGSQARFLLSKLNPSTNTLSLNTPYSAEKPAVQIFTDDVSLQTFMTHLKRLSVSG